MNPNTTGGNEGVRVRAEALYARALASIAPSHDLDLAGLCGEAPELDAELRRLHEDWRRVAGVHAALAAQGSLTDRIRRRFEGRIDPGLSLEPKPAPGPDSISGRTLKRLEEHAPRQSRYELVEEIARGGMGVVFKVWDPDLRRTLAMKVALVAREAAKAGSGSIEDEKPLGRFLEEAQVTGQLDHPGIVPVHELGLDPDGRVYFTMRLVKGRDLLQIFELVREKKEGWTETRALGALLKACEAISYAHEKRVIHRDLKPANVMVGRFGEVYVMDWGLARVLGQQDRRDIRLRRPEQAPLTLVRTDRREVREAESDSPLMTMDGDVLGTPAYMSPEQARGEVEKLDARSDVYSLGAILYHLLAGHMPYVPAGARMNTLAVWGLVQVGPPVALAQVAPGAPAELVAIAEKAMAREPDARYPSMQELEEDLRSYLEGRVVRAYETGAAAELRKWVRRNRATAAATAAAMLLLIVGSGLAAMVQVRANARLAEKNTELAAASAEAQRERDAGVEVNEFLVGLFESPDPRKARGELVTAKQLLDRGARTIAERGDTDPLVWARLRDSMGQAYCSLGLYAEARPLLEGALAHRREALGEDHPDALESRNMLALLCRLQGRYDEAEALYTGALETERRVLGDDHSATLATVGQLGLLRYYQGRYGEAEDLLRQALDGRRRVLGEGHADTLRSHVDLALTFRKQARYGEARALLEQALDGYHRTRADDHPDALKTLNDLAGVHLLERRFDVAQPLYERALDGRRRVLGPEHPDTLTSLNDLAYLHVLAGRREQAEPLYVAALGGCRSALGDDHPFTLAVLTNLAALYQQQDRPDDAEPLFQEALDASRRVLGADHPNTLGAQNGLAFLYFSEERYEEAEPLYQEALEAHRRVLGPDHPNSLTILHNLASLYGAQERWEEAEPLVRDLLLRTPRTDAEYPDRQALFDTVLAALRDR